jgi:biotin carboxylase
MEVKSADDVQHACREMGVPLLLKVANGAGSIGQQVINSETEAQERLQDLLDAVGQAWKAGKKDPIQGELSPRLIAETIITSTTDSWYDDTTWGDYLSVEGLVRGGVYFPLAITGRLPTIPPFIEVSNIAPCPIDRQKKDVIVAAARRAIDALELQDCATHTEVKLCRDGAVQLVETAARMGGVAIAKELSHVYGINYVELLIDTLLGIDGPIPGFEQRPPTGAAASLSLIGANAKGEAWSTQRLFDPRNVDWRALAGPRVDVCVEYTQSMQPGDPMPRMFSAGGTLTNAGIAFVTAPDLHDLLAGLYRILNGFEAALPLA